MTITRDTLLRIERAGVRAWPAGETAIIDGWLWRSTGGGSQRANSVSPLAFTGTDPERAIDEAERRYRARGAAAMFQLTDVAAPADLDARLARRGYRVQEPCTTLAKMLDAPVMPHGIEIADVAGADWLGNYLAGVTESRRPQAASILARVPAPRAFFLLRRDGETIGSALGVARDGIVIAECVMTRADRRRTGAGRIVMQALEAWGVHQGARIAALQAVAANAPAQALYAGLDYVKVCSYHYRVRDL